MVEAEPLDVLAQDQRKDVRQAVDVAGRHREPDAAAHARVGEVAQTLNRGVERSGLAALVVVERLGPVDRDASVDEARLLEARGHVAIDLGAVRRQGEPQPALDAVGHEIQEVRAREGLSAGDEHGGHGPVRQVVQKRDRLVRGELVGRGRALGVRVAVAARKVAGAGDVPDHDRVALGRGVGRGFAVTLLSVAERV